LVKPEKRIAARQQLEAMIRDRSMLGQRLLGERELAAELGVGRKTLRGALAELEAEGLLDRRQGAGTFVASGESNGRRSGAARVAVIVGSHAEREAPWSYQGELIRGVLGQAPRLRAECAVFSLNDPEEAEQIRRAASMRGFSGFISVAQDAPDLLAHLTGLRRGPVVLLDHTVRDMPVIGVVDGSFQGARAATRHLLGLGHRRVAFLNCGNSGANNPWKHGGYQAALADRGLAYDPELVAGPEQFTGGDTDMGSFVRAALDRLLALPDPPTALVGFDDFRALPALDALRERGRKPGEDFAVAGMGDSAIRRGVCDWLTSTRTYPRKMGGVALRAALQGGLPSEGRTIIVPNRLYIRRSTCPPPTLNGVAP
jgi:DNA-binding LacI/PurR family transcriptional regulator